MQIQLPRHVKEIIASLQANGFEAFAVGGCVRDSILGREPQDWDITTSAKPEEIKACFSHTIDTGIQHGTVTVMLEHTGYEVTTYRIDGEYEDARHPKEVTFTSSLEEDLKRRDFTINAMAYNETAGLVDLFGGQEDLKMGIIRCVGNPRERFSEDALRMLRAVRFAAQLGFELDPATAEAIKDLAPTLEKISAERIHAELEKLILSPHPEEMRRVYELGLSKVFFPEFDAMMETPQHTAHHIYSVGEHTIAAMQYAEPNRILRFTMLFHDIGKPVCRSTDANGTDHFYGHPGKGEEMARAVMRRLKFDNDTIREVCNLVKWHEVSPTIRREISPDMRHEAEPLINEKTTRRLIHKMGEEAYPMIFEVHMADLMAQSTYYRQEKIDALQRFRESYEAIKAKEQCLSLKDLAVNGKDLMELGFPKGPLLGKVLNALLEEVVETPELNEREVLLEKARVLLADEQGKVDEKEKGETST